MEVKFGKDSITITLKYDEKGRTSSSGKTVLHASEGEKVRLPNGKDLKIQVNAYTAVD